MISPRSIVAPLIALEYRKLLYARARDPEVTLSMAERNLLVDICEGRGKQKQGRPKTPAAIKRGRALEVAADVARLEFGQKWKSEAAVVRQVAKDHRRSDRSVRNDRAFAERYLDGDWWDGVCRLAKKGKHHSRRVLFAVIEECADGFHVRIGDNEVRVTKSHEDAIKLANKIGEQVRPPNVSMPKWVVALTAKLDGRDP